MYDSVREIYAQWVRTQGASDLSILQPIRNQAFALLVDEVKRWTSAIDVPNDNTNVIRITMTYISPELAHVIILNHQLYKNFLPETQFEQSLIERMTEIANREELIFLMTITYSQYNSEVPTEFNRIMLTMPMDSVLLINSENLQVNVHSVDPHLRQEIIISKGPSAGYVTFPMGLGTAENCREVINRRMNTEINVSTRGITINGTGYAPQLIWFVKNHPLVEMDEPLIPSISSYVAPAAIPIHHPPPIPVRSMPADHVDDVYWQQMALHVWGYMTDP